jgi:glutathione synthase/RimK-type ligase-like ATP-grasp enzyme
MADRRVALATCADFARLDDDERAVIPALAAWGIRAEPVVWTDETVDWDAFDLTVIRSTWDYVDRHDEFLDWAASVPRLANAADVVRWNTDKRYLRELAEADLPVVATSWLAPGDEVDLPQQGKFVLKPAVGAGSRDAGRFELGDPSERALAFKHAQRLLDRGATVLIQPYLDAVDTVGETALLFLGGRFSHAIRKAPLLTGPDTAVEGLFRQEEIAPRSPSRSELSVAEAVLAGLPSGWADGLLYARVDLIPGESGQPVLLELELTEPSLFLSHDELAADRFAAAIGTHLDRVLKTK